jgi:dTMP kinase
VSTSQPIVPDGTPLPGSSPVAESAGTASGIRAVLGIRAFRRLWLCLGFSSLGDWLGLLATTAMAATLTVNDGYRQQNFAIATVLLLRLLPALVAGPVGGYLADRLDRRVTLVVGDVLRFAIMLSIPIVGTLTWLFVATVLIEFVGLVWLPAKDASVPNLVPRSKLAAANQLFLATTYGSALPAAALFTLLSLVNRSTYTMFGWFAESSQDLALYVNALTFLASAATIITLKELTRSRAARTAEPNPIRALLDGWKFIRDTPLIRGLVVGIVGAFAAGGVVVGLGRTYVVDLGAGDAGYGVLFGAVFAGLAAGMFLGPTVVPSLSRRRVFALSLIMAGVVLLLLALVANIVVVTMCALGLGLFAGICWVNGYTMLGLEVADNLRGRTFAFVASLTRLSMAAVLAAAPAVAGAIGTHEIHLFDESVVSYNGAAITIAIGAVIAIVVGVVSYRQMVTSRVSLWSQIRGGLRRPLAHRADQFAATGVFLSLEGGDGAGKSTQSLAVADWLRAQGWTVLETREPGGTALGEKVRSILLEPGPGMSGRTEALLFAADRAEHVASTIMPALSRGEAVLTDRYVDSSLAYQGAGRVLSREEIARINAWATQGLRPHLTILLDVDPAVSADRARARSGSPDRLEAESVGFRQAVREQFVDLANHDPERYLLVDAGMGVGEVTKRIIERLETMPELARAKRQHPHPVETPGTTQAAAAPTVPAASTAPSAEPAEEPTPAATTAT